MSTLPRPCNTIKASYNSIKISLFSYKCGEKSYLWSDNLSEHFLLKYTEMLLYNDGMLNWNMLPRWRYTTFSETFPSIDNVTTISWFFISFPRRSHGTPTIWVCFENKSLRSSFFWWSGIWLSCCLYFNGAHSRLIVTYFAKNAEFKQ